MRTPRDIVFIGIVSLLFIGVLLGSWDALQPDHAIRVLAAMLISFVVWKPLYRRLDGKTIRIAGLAVDASLVPDLAVSLVFASVVFRIYPSVFFDDAGFILRYLDNFSEGYFYRFNKEDDPVFGISSFLYGLFTGILAMTRLWSPDDILHATGFLGLAGTGLAVMRILRVFITYPPYLFLSWLCVMYGSKIFLGLVKQGMETPFHLAVVFTAVLFFLVRKPRWMWCFLVLAVISKLDTVPLVLIIAGIYFTENHRRLLPLWSKNSVIREAFLFGVLPILVWIGIATWLFGSPLPQSAYAKIYFHAHPDDHWFPFLTYFTENAQRFPIFCLFLALFIVHVLEITYKEKADKLSTTVCGFAFMGTMSLYYFYNPVEKMGWYYAMPDLLMEMQLLISIFYLVNNYVVRYAAFLTSLAAAAFLLCVWPDVTGGRIWMDQYLHIVEWERTKIGEYLGEVTKPGETVVASHGLIARHARGYVIDMSGLNSRLATAYRRNMDSLLTDHRAEWVIHHGTTGFIDEMNRHDYTLHKAFYDITQYNAAWYIYRINNSKNYAFTIRKVDISHAGADDEKSDNGSVAMLRGRRIVLGGIPQDVHALHFGVLRRQERFPLVLQAFRGDSIIVAQDTFFIKALPYTTPPAEITEAVVYRPGKDAQVFDRIVLTAAPDSIAIEVLSPVSEIRQAREEAGPQAPSN